MEKHTSPKKEFLNSEELVEFILKHRKNLITIGLMAAFLSAVVSFLITPKYTSTVILFPAQSTSLSKSLFSNDIGGKQDVLKFGEEEEAEQMLQILYSEEILSRLNRKYNLFKHYDIDLEDKYHNTQLAEEFTANVTFKRTEFQSIRIDVEDASPDTAALIANDIAAYIDSVKNKMYKQRAIEAANILHFEYDRLENRIQKMEDSLKFYRRLGVLEFEVQVEKFSEQLGIAINAGRRDAEELLKSKLDTLAKYGATQVALREQILQERERLVDLLESYEEARVDAERDFPQKFILNSAYPAEKKTSPVRWLIVLITTLTTLLVSIIAMVWLDENNISSLKRLISK